MKLSRSMVLTAAVGSLITGACATDHERKAAEQEHLGRGIVLGTIGVQSERGVTAEDTRVVAGTLTSIEGGAYVLRERSGRERRLSVDANTRMDRPALVGDSIEALLDTRGRALRIRIIDAEPGRDE